LFGSNSYYHSLQVILLFYKQFTMLSHAILVAAEFFNYQAVALFKSYFGGNFDEDAIRNNFVLIYELLDGEESSYFWTLLATMIFSACL
jgi:AP-2 complex subunit mu-1